MRLSLGLAEQEPLVAKARTASGRYGVVPRARAACCKTGLR